MQTVRSDAAMPAEALVMVIDDDDLLRESLATVLTGRGFRVQEHASGRSALHALASGERPDLVLLDLRMPDISGWEFRQRQLAAAPVASIPVIAMSADDSPTAAAVNAAAFLAKPFTSRELLHAVEAVVTARQKRVDSGHQDQRHAPVMLPRCAGFSGEATCRQPRPELSAEQSRQKALALVATGLSHVVNNTLQAVLSYAQCPAGEGACTPDLERSIFQSVHECAAVLRKFADGALMEQRAERRLGHASSALVEAWQQLCPSGFLLETSGLPLLEDAHVDPEAILLMTKELILNAVEAMARGSGVLQIRIAHRTCELGDLQDAHPVANRKAGTWCCVEVIDQGEGMGPAVLPQIWLPFYSTRFPGRGLGLFSVLARVKAVGGLVEAESIAGGGTTVRLLLPIAERVPAVVAG